MKLKSNELCRAWSFYLEMTIDVAPPPESNRGSCSVRLALTPPSECSLNKGNVYFYLYLANIRQLASKSTGVAGHYECHGDEPKLKGLTYMVEGVDVTGH